MHNYSCYNRQFEFVLDDWPFLGYVYSAYRHCVLHLYASGSLRLVSICVNVYVARMNPLIEPMYLHIHRFCFTIRYHYCLRIYNRFNWNKFYSSRWQEENEADEERRNFGDLDPNSSSDLKTIVPVKNLQKIGTTSKNREG